MRSAVIITIIVCITLVILSVMNSVEKALKRKEVMKKVDKFNKAFKDGVGRKEDK